MPSWLVLVIGGVIPSVLWGLTGVFQKQSAVAGFNPFQYMLVLGLVVTVTGGIGLLLFRAEGWSFAGFGSAALAGLGYAVATALMSLVLWRYGVPISKLAPILSCNILVTVAIGAFILGEGASFNVIQLLIGTLLIVGGAILVSAA
jgi:hypothetical protein